MRGAVRKLFSTSSSGIWGFSRALLIPSSVCALFFCSGSISLDWKISATNCLPWCLQFLIWLIFAQNVGGKLSFVLNKTDCALNVPECGYTSPKSRQWQHPRLHLYLQSIMLREELVVLFMSFTLMIAPPQAPAGVVLNSVSLTIRVSSYINLNFILNANSLPMLSLNKT